MDEVQTKILGDNIDVAICRWITCTALLALCKEKDPAAKLFFFFANSDLKESAVPRVSQ